MIDPWDGVDLIDRATGKGRYADEYDPGRPEDEPSPWAYAAVVFTLLGVFVGLVWLAAALAR